MVSISGDSTPQIKINDGITVTIDNGGNWSSSMIIPINSTTIAGGTHELKFKDSSGREGVLTFTIAERALVLDPAASQLNSIVSISGSGYPADNTMGRGRPRAISGNQLYDSWNGPDGSHADAGRRR